MAPRCEEPNRKAHGTYAVKECHRRRLAPGSGQVRLGSFTLDNIRYFEDILASIRFVFRSRFWARGAE